MIFAEKNRNRFLYLACVEFACWAFFSFTLQSYEFSVGLTNFINIFSDYKMS